MLSLQLLFSSIVPCPSSSVVTPVPVILTSSQGFRMDCLCSWFIPQSRLLLLVAFYGYFIGGGNCSIHSSFLWGFYCTIVSLPPPNPKSPMRFKSSSRMYWFVNATNCSSWLGGTRLNNRAWRSILHRVTLQGVLLPETCLFVRGGYPLEYFIESPLEFKERGEGTKCSTERERANGLRKTEFK